MSSAAAALAAVVAAGSGYWQFNHWHREGPWWEPWFEAYLHSVKPKAAGVAFAPAAAGVLDVPTVSVMSATSSRKVQQLCLDCVFAGVGWPGHWLCERCP